MHTSPLAHAPQALRRATDLPPTIQAQHAPQSLIHWHLLAIRPEGPFKEWLHRRLGHMLEHAPVEGELDLVMQRLRWMAMDVPTCVVLAFLHILANSWPTTRRMSGGTGTCLMGCHVVEDDDLRHFLRCPRLGVVVVQRRRRPPVWCRAWHIRIACHVLPTSRGDAASRQFGTMLCTGYGNLRVR